MTAPAFPVSQLGRPTVNYSLKPDDLRVRADTVSGLANSYNGSNAALTTISVKWEWGSDNYAVFQDWYRNDCKDGSIEFTIAEMYLFGSMGELTARFTAPPKATYKAWNHYSVSATLETRTTDYISEATLDASLTNYEQPELLLQVVDGRILEETGHSTSVNGTVIVSATRTHDGYGSISNAADGQSTALGYFSITHPITLSGDFCIEGYWMPLVGSNTMTWLSSFPAFSAIQFQTWSIDNTPSVDINGYSVIDSSITTSPNNWYHIAIERYNGIVTLYINGNSAGTYSYSGELSFDGIMLGSGPNENNIQSPCCWENVRILKRSVYMTAFTPPSRFESRPSDCPVWPFDVFGNPASDGYGEQAQSSSLRGKTDGYARPAMRRNSPNTVTQVPVKWEMSQANKILFDAWYHYKLVNGAAWFWIYTQFHGVWQYIKVRFVESISVEYESVDWWQVSGTLETVEYNYLPLADCPTLVAPTNIDTLLPIITDQPDDVSQATGTTVALSVTATTTTGTLSYQWYFGSTALVGATSASYEFTLSDTTDGGYHVVVSNDVGHVTSRTAGVIIAGIVSQFSSLVSGRDICQASNGNFYVVSTSGVYEVLQDGTYSLISTTATGDGICQKSDGYLYVSGSVTWKLDTSGNTVQYSLRGGNKICEGYNGLLYVTGFSDYSSSIWSINSDGTYQSFASVGYYPYTSFEGICYDGTNFYVKNANNSLLCVISNSGSLVTSNLVQVDGYSIINSSDGFLYVLASQGQYPLRRVTKAGVVTDFSTVAGHGICEASDHNFYVVDYANGIFKVTH